MIKAGRGHNEIVRVRINHPLSCDGFPLTGMSGDDGKLHVRSDGQRGGEASVGLQEHCADPGTVPNGDGAGL